MKFSHEFLPEDRFGLWKQIVRAAEAIPRDSAEGYGKGSKKEPALCPEGASNQGFTLIEVLMVVFILGIIVVIGGNLFFSILKGASKAEVVKEVKQNGDYALGVMERMIRNAQELKECTSGSIKITNPDKNETIFAFSGTGISSNSASLTSENVRLVTGSYTCNLTAVPPIVTISFSLTQAGLGARPEEQAQVSFQTTVGLRTY